MPEEYGCPLRQAGGTLLAMSLTVGTGPFGHAPSGKFDFEAPAQITFVERHGPRVRGLKDGESVVDSDRVWLVYRTGSLPQYAFPAEDVKIDAEPEPALQGYVRVPWTAVDRWLEEDTEIVVHPHDPYHRIEVLDSSRHVVVRVNGERVAESRAPRILYETGLPPRYYLSRADVHAELLPEDDLRTGCAYKGFARYFGAAGAGVVAWTYEEPLREGEPIRDRICFFQERDEVEFTVDGEVQERPRTPWSGTEWVERYRGRPA
jgi:uncharacterized protein (DUF427 family)